MSLDPSAPSDGSAPLAGDEDSVDSRAFRLSRKRGFMVVIWLGRDEGPASEDPADALVVSKSCIEDHSSPEAPVVTVNPEKPAVVDVRASRARLLDL